MKFICNFPSSLFAFIYLPPRGVVFMSFYLSSRFFCALEKDGKKSSIEEKFLKRHWERKNALFRFICPPPMYKYTLYILPQDENRKLNFYFYFMDVFAVFIAYHIEIIDINLSIDELEFGGCVTEWSKALFC